MTGTTDHVLYAAIAFIAVHVMSSTPLRAALVRMLGEGPFRGLFSVLSLLLIAWLVWAYMKAPFDPVWDPPAWAPWVPLVAVPLALILIVAGVSTRNPTMAGMEESADAPDPAPGIISITRHPVFWGIGLWALAHLAVNGDLASIFFFGAFALLAFAGMPLIDRKKEETLGAKWGPVAMRTSVLPFGAALQKRTAVDWKGVGLVRPAIGLALYGLLLGGHTHLFGAPPWPV